MCALGNFWCCREPFVAGAAFQEVNVCLKHGVQIHNIQDLTSYVTGNTIRPHYRDKPVNNVQGVIFIFLKII